MARIRNPKVATTTPKRAAARHRKNGPLKVKSPSEQSSQGSNSSNGRRRSIKKPALPTPKHVRGRGKKANPFVIDSSSENSGKDTSRGKRRSSNEDIKKPALSEEFVTEDSPHKRRKLSSSDSTPCRRSARLAAKNSSSPVQPEVVEKSIIQPVAETGNTESCADGAQSQAPQYEENTPPEAVDKSTAQLVAELEGNDSDEKESPPRTPTGPEQVDTNLCQHEIQSKIPAHAVQESGDTNSCTNESQSRTYEDPDDAALLLLHEEYQPSPYQDMDRLSDLFNLEQTPTRESRASSTSDISGCETDGMGEAIERHDFAHTGASEEAEEYDEDDQASSIVGWRICGRFIQYQIEFENVPDSTRWVRADSLPAYPWTSKIQEFFTNNPAQQKKFRTTVNHVEGSGTIHTNFSLKVYGTECNDRRTIVFKVRTETSAIGDAYTNISGRKLDAKWKEAVAQYWRERVYDIKRDNIRANFATKDDKVGHLFGVGYPPAPRDVVANNVQDNVFEEDAESEEDGLGQLKEDELFELCD
ncbi:hypothetical protein AMS68_003516 [Peltaster fructicola]|uniref:Uncharacterized protein n=1 Tax=Peltaster fructicola TaxID=286661 RepID=A0A6H0XTQ8_9PEZI|nr:hypothetical protein AMS68_003516 [Peltaster fructicola]